MTTTVTRRRRPDGRLGRAAMFGLLAFAAALCSASEARAQWTTSGNTVHPQDATKNVGVGTSSAGNVLEVRRDQPYGGTLSSMTQLVVRNDSPTGFSALSVWGAGAERGRYQYNSALPNMFLTSTGAIPLYFGTNNTIRMAVDGTTGNVGIGTTDPFGVLQVKKDQNAPTQIYLTNETDGTLAFTRMLFGDHYADTDSFFTSYNTGFTGNGTLGIPGAGLAEFAANTNATGMAVGTRGAAPFIVTTNATERLRVSSGGNVGVGTASPVGRLDVRQVGNAGTLATILTSSGASEDTFIRGGSNSAAVHIGDLTSTTSKLLLMENGGNVGIGTTAPSTALHVVGDVTVSGNISAKYQDVAEWVPSREQLAAGTVVVVDAEGVNRVLASAAAYDTRVAGVVSAQPGLLLGEGGEGKVKVATTGRVKVRVDATRAPIRAGDLLVTSGAAGVAMRSEPVSVGGVSMHRPGTIIGKALESLEKGTGEILVLLSLQ